MTRPERVTYTHLDIVAELARGAAYAAAMEAYLSGIELTWLRRD